MLSPFINAGMYIFSAKVIGLRSTDCALFVNDSIDIDSACALLIFY
jgi:hypothetical protein